jgi:uncharacterized tellurite resistance protein B-like protein
MSTATALTSSDGAPSSGATRVLSVGAGERGVFVQRTTQGYAYRVNPTAVAVQAPWREQVARYDLIHSDAVAAHLTPAVRRGRGALSGALTGLGAAGLVTLGSGGLLPALAVGGILGAALGLVVRRGHDPLVLAYDPADEGLRAFVQRVAAATSGLSQSTVLRGSVTTPTVSSPMAALGLTSTERCALPFVISIPCPAWRLDRVTVLFLPDRLATLADGRVEFHRYDRVSVEQSSVDIVEPGPPPRDASVMGANVIRYGQLHLRLGFNLEVTVMASHLAAMAVAGALLAEALRSHSEGLPTVPTAPPPTPPRVNPAPTPVATPLSTSRPPSAPPPRPSVAPDAPLSMQQAIPHPSFEPKSPPAAPHPPPVPAPTMLSGTPLAPPRTSRPPVAVGSFDVGSLSPPPPVAHASVPADLPTVSVVPPVPPALPLRSVASPPTPPAARLNLPPAPPPPATKVASVPPAMLAASAPPPVPLPTLAVPASTPPSTPTPPLPSSDRFIGVAPSVVVARKEAVSSSTLADEDAPPTVAAPVRGASFALPRPEVPVAPAEKGRWLAAGESVEIRGFQIPGGLLYVGDRLPGTQGANDPSLIRPGLHTSRNFDWAGASIGYWPAYSELSRECRGTYLQWLATGRRDPSAGISYVFVFFYGLERRALVDPSRTAADLEAIRKEVLALREVYANGSFQGYSASLLEALSARSGSARRTSPEPVRYTNGEVPYWLRLEIAHRAQEGTPLDAHWALAWVEAARPPLSPTVRARCDAEVRALFEVRYREAFATGVVPSRGRARLAFTYRTASNALGGAYLFERDDLTDPNDGPGAEKLLDQLAALVQRCVEECEPYSRWLGRNPQGRGSIPALAHLPTALPPSLRKPAQEGFIRDLQARTAVQAHVVLAVRDLLKQIAWSSTTKLSKGDITLIIQLLERVGFGVEPDLRFRAPAITPGGDLVLFRLPPDSPTAPSREYEAATLFAQLAAVMSTADGEVGVEERRHAERHIEEALHLGAGERARLAAHLEWLLRSPPSAAAIKKRLTGVPEAGRLMLASFLVGVAGADGRIDPGEIKLLRKLYPLLGLEADLVYSHLHALAATSPSIVPPAPSKGRRSAPPSAPPPGPVKLDMDRVQATLAQTAAVTELLGSIFADPDEPRAPVAPAAPGATGRTVAGLDAAHSALLLALAQRPRWTRAEFEREAAALGLMPDGALEILNDKACDQCGSPLCDGDDPIDVDPDVARELTDA